MSRKLHPLAAAIRAIDALSDNEKLAVRDYLRPAPKPRSKPKPERKPSQKRKAGKDDGDDNPPFAGLMCAACNKPFGDNDHHLESRPTYHPFQSAGEASKGVGV